MHYFIFTKFKYFSNRPYKINNWVKSSKHTQNNLKKGRGGGGGGGWGSQIFHLPVDYVNTMTSDRNMKERKQEKSDVSFVFIPATNNITHKACYQ